MASTTISLAQQIACVKREIALRVRVYPGFVRQRRMTQDQADKEVACMQGVLHTLTALQPPDRAEDLFAQQVML